MFLDEIVSVKRLKCVPGRHAKLAGKDYVPAVPLFRLETSVCVHWTRLLQYSTLALLTANYCSCAMYFKTDTKSVSKYK